MNLAEYKNRSLGTERIKQAATALPYLPSTRPDGNYPKEITYEFSNGFHLDFPVLRELQQSNWQWDLVSQNSPEWRAYPLIKVLKPHAEQVQHFVEHSKVFGRVCELTDRQHLFYWIKYYCFEYMNDRELFDFYNSFLQSVSPNGLGRNAYHAAYLAELNPLLQTAADEMIVSGVPIDVLGYIGDFEEGYLDARYKAIFGRT